MCVSWWRSSQAAQLALRLHHPVFGLAEVVQPALGQQIQRQRQPGQPVGQNPVVNVAATGKVAGQLRGPLPHLAPAARILVIAIGERLAAGEPQPLDEKHSQQPRRNALRQIEAKAAKESKPVGHHVEWDLTSLNGAPRIPIKPHLCRHRRAWAPSLILETWNCG